MLVKTKTYQRSKSQKMSFVKGSKNTITQYGKSTTIHGIAYIFDESSSLLEKFLWLIIFALATFFAISFSLEAYQQWQDDPVLTTLKTTGKFDPKMMLIVKLTLSEFQGCQSRKLIIQQLPFVVRDPLKV